MKFYDDKYYHVYNRGVEKREIFMDKWDYTRFLRGMREFNNESKKEERDFVFRKAKGNKELSSGYPELNSYIQDLPKLVEIISYCLLPNHYHFLVKQLADNGISKFMQKVGLGYTHYFNYKNNRSGVLFQGGYKAIEVKTYSHFLKLAVYVNCNYEIHKLGKSENWIWSSYLDYIGARNGVLCNKDSILKEFCSKEEYKLFCQSTIKDIQNFKEAKV